MTELQMILILAFIFTVLFFVFKKNRNVNRFREDLKRGSLAIFYINNDRCIGTVQSVNDGTVLIYFNEVIHYRPLDEVYPVTWL